MDSLPTTPADSEAPPPSPESTRLWLMRRLLRASARRYQASLAFAREVEGHFPEEYRRAWSDPASESFRHRLDRSESGDDWPDGERGAWLRIRHEADSEFYSAEVDLAVRIVNLFDYLASEGLRVGKVKAGSEYPERAVTAGGRTFTVLYDPAEYEDGAVIISMTPIERVVSLDD